MGRHLCIKVFIEDPENEEVNITTLSSEDGNVKTVTINSRFIHSCLEEIQKNKSNESPNFIIPPVLINKTDSNLDLETETILCNNNKTETYLKEDRDKIPKLNENCEGGSFQDVQHIKNDKYQLQEKDSIGSKTLDVSYSIRKKIVSRNEIESNSMSNRKDKIISSPVLSKDEHIYNNNDDVSNESTVRSDVSTGSYISNPIDSIKNVKYNVDDFLSEVNKQKSFEKKYGSSFMSDALYDVETQIEYSNNDTESCDQIMEEYYVVDGVIGSRYNSKIKKEEFLLKLKRCIAKNEPWNLIVDPATCPNLPIFEYGRLFIATPDSVKHMEHFEGNVLCDKFLSENSVLQDENLMDSVDLKKSEEVIPNFENETDSIRENSDFGLDLEMCDTGTNFKDTVFPELAEKLPEVADGIINNTNIAHLHIRRKRINVDNVTSAMTGLSSTGRCQVRRKSIHKLGSTFNASNRKKIEFEKLKKTLNKKIICGRTKLFNETCKSNEPLREVALKSLQNVVGISDSNELIMNNNSYQPQKLTKKNVIESDIDGFSKKVNCKQLRTPVRKKGN